MKTQTHRIVCMVDMFSCFKSSQFYLYSPKSLICFKRLYSLYSIQHPQFGFIQRTRLNNSKITYFDMMHNIVHFTIWRRHFFIFKYFSFLICRFYCETAATSSVLYQKVCWNSDLIKLWLMSIAASVCYVCPKP